VGSGDTRVRRHLGERGQSADAQASIGFDPDLVQSRYRLQIHDPGRLDQVLLQMVEQVDPPGLQDGARFLGEEVAGLSDTPRPRELEPVHS
jgi:hypothetical protein